MQHYRKDAIIFIIFTFVFALPRLHAQQLLEWQEREHPPRFEGTKLLLKKAQVELVSALAHGSQKLEANKTLSTGGEVRILFFVPPGTDDSTHVFISVREFRRHNYWMQPQRQRWDRGWSEFSWPTGVVLSQLQPEPNLQDLSAVARIGAKDIAVTRKLIPVTLYQNEPPQNITHYQFILRSPGNADLLGLHCEWYQLEGSTRLKVGDWQPQKERIPAGRPVYIEWECQHEGAALPQGWYELSITGTLSYPSRDEELDEHFEIYHTSTVEVPR